MPDRGDRKQDGPPVIALGVGCERNAAAAELEKLVRGVLAAHGLSAQAIACVASLDVKADEGAIHALAASLGVPARFFDAAVLAHEESRLSSPSETVKRAVGVAGVAEAAALACVGRNGRLLVTKQRSSRATCALAIASSGADGRS
jgi:cobalt-precorrin 5A hydrolase / precorrin-3B C17-methyltransferase